MGAALILITRRAAPPRAAVWLGRCSSGFTGAVLMIFLPLGVDEAKADRLPWVSITIAAL